MDKRNVWVGVFVTAAVVFFGAGLFLIGNQHKAFRRHSIFYTEFANVDGIADGAKVRVQGLDAGEVEHLEIPSSPAKKFRLKLQVEDRVRGLIRDDSLVSVETSGIVGDKFLLIHAGSERAAEAAPDTTLQGKEPFEIAVLMQQATGIMQQVSGTVTQVDGTVADLQHRLAGTLATLTATVRNANGLVTDVRGGKGAVGALLADPQTAADVKQTVANARDATGQLKTASTQMNGMLADAQRRQLVAKVDDTLNNTKAATQQIDQASRRVNTTLNTAFAQDQYGETAGTNLQQTLSNVNAATGNLADDTEALKHEFFFRGFFKKRGYDNLRNLPVASYRSGELFKKNPQNREWLPASLFAPGPEGKEMLSADGRAQIDAAVSRIPDLYSAPLIVEGYADRGTPSAELTASRRRATLVRAYLQLHYQVEPRKIGIIALSAQPPADAGRDSWDGVCLLALSAPK